MEKIIKNKRAFTLIDRVGQAGPALQTCGVDSDNAPAKGHTAAFIPPHPAFGHLLPQGARRTTRGFTLIELLVVVLIIGILAAVAIPQYQKAVEKSKAMEALSMLKSVFQAANAYYLANGSWPTQFNQLDTDIPWTGTKQWYNLGHHQDYRSNKNWSIQILNSSDLGRAIVIGRISGNYKGAGFRMYHTKPSSSGYNFRTNYPICIETTNNSSVAIPFSNEQDSYCAKIFHGTFISTPSADRMYILP